LLGKPGTPDSERIRFDGGVYRYHPTRHVWEPYADGTTNPWGIDWNDYGEAFVCNCVNPHLFHVIQGAHYEPWRDRESSQYAYERIATIADHLHFVGTANVRDGLGSEEEDHAGGGHAHCGTMIYLGDNWPDHYRNMVFMNNIHGRRINNDLLRRKGSGYTASHGPDVMRSLDPWYMGVTLAYGPDGAVYASDWSDTGECHSVKNTRRHTGRIYKITYKPGYRPNPVKDYSTLSNAELVQLQLHKNDWQVRHARRLLQERAAHGQAMTEVHQQLYKMFQNETDVPRQLRLIWALYVTGGTNEAFLSKLLDHESEYLRGWAVKLLCENNHPSTAGLGRMQELAESGDSSYVRLQLASALQRLDAKDRWPIAEALVRNKQDAKDQNLPLMIWYSMEPLIQADLKRFIRLAEQSEIPIVTRHIARRVSSRPDDSEGLELLLELLGDSSDPPQILDLLAGLLEGLKGTRTRTMPEAWPKVFDHLSKLDDRTIRREALRLALIFDDPAALKQLREIAANQSEPKEDRQAAVQSLVQKKPKDLPDLLFALMGDLDTQDVAIKGLAEFSDPEVGRRILTLYPSFNASARQNALQTLASRKSWALALLDAVERKQIPASELTAYTARQLESLKDPNISARMKSLWGNIRPSPAEKTKLIASYKKRLTSESLAYADRALGRVLFQKNCANCHKLFGEGGAIGPDITGAQRTNLDYLLENLIDPSASVAKDYQMELIATTSGRTITGLVIEQSPSAITVQTANEKLVIPRDEIEERAASEVSMMPDGILEKLTPEEVRDLIGYVSGLKQVPLPESE
jgi:putative heme-binding domain-containing protein